MSTLLIGNSYNDSLVADLASFREADRQVAGNISLRMIWLAEPGDILVLPQPPRPEFVRYALTLRGLDVDSVLIMVPPAGRLGSDVLTGDRLLDGGFLAELRALVTKRNVDHACPYVFDATTAHLIRELGLHRSMPGFGFYEAGGADLVNSKSVFRAMAGGLGLPVTTGIVATSRAKAQEFAADLVAANRCVIVKQDFHAGGYGNEIISPRPDVQPLGAPSLRVLDSQDAVRRHFDSAWSRYSVDGRHKVIVEDYVPDSMPLGAEVRITAEGSRLHHIGEMRMAPVFDGVVIPGAVLSEKNRAEFNDIVLRVCDSIRALGYVGLANIDGILTPDGDLLLTEMNGRLGGTTHLHWIADALVGHDYQTECVLMTRNHWHVSSFDDAVARLRTSGLLFEPDARAGVLIGCEHIQQSGVVEYCIVAKDVDAAEEIETSLLRLPGGSLDTP
ncbi:hypothetical protein ThrDRAFT_04486 [Frankia casuarinae]|uniref:ATP-grasp domain-containing protein n=2 Tax=Frankia casuarinae (strain DSM 45818 / CECT 9043 / HFP020203 / CcI3) TaxID=106370 RepID=Q2JBA3_FRACC|nr:MULTISPECIES: peptide ligase PGM1-related protein [Frankia]ABD11439.1 hypothetical protein Francci3_2066 [Frankia casuarinae]ETA00354.1 hypothetical protein CcI6DRAFT_04236 [Frankia sp. CcI6]EYT89889.1 hypothetical protein ThrDRAFT_04486 [Frankia casuarinae]KDA40654.1 hypothetical protein BMG523Draft_04537 [Frankia sp. BMG5.23]KFB02715.1 ATP-grasp domain [Frankia sp. Allo2]